MKPIMITLLLLILSTFSTSLKAAEPTCYVHTDGRPYCNYSGKVKQLYVNVGNTILIYIDTPFDLAKVAEVGFSGVTSTTAIAVSMTENPEFAKMLYSTALAAKSQDKDVTLQMWGKHGGYLKADRIWLRE